MPEHHGIPDSVPLSELGLVLAHIRKEQFRADESLADAEVRARSESEAQIGLAIKYVMTKMLNYRSRLETKEAERQTTLRAMQELGVLTSIQADDLADEEMSRLSGQNEIICHEWAGCACTISKLALALANLVYGTQTHRRSTALEPYCDFRDEYEHVDERADGRRHPERLVRIIRTEMGTTVEMGPETDDAGRFIIGDHRVAIDPRGIKEVDHFIESTLQEIHVALVHTIEREWANVPGVVINWDVFDGRSKVGGGPPPTNEQQERGER
jgi:hypothetical protein